MLCVPGDLHRPLYLIHTGAVAVLDAVPEEGSKDQLRLAKQKIIGKMDENGGKTLQMGALNNQPHIHLI